MKRTTCSMSAIDPAKAGKKRGIMAARAGRGLRTAIMMTDQYFPTDTMYTSSWGVRDIYLAVARM
jgi:hypothetical protein